jgi:biotin synthase-related radical SAM superfamily protein
MSASTEEMLRAIQAVQDAYGKGNVPMVLIVEAEEHQEVFAIVTRDKADQLVLLRNCAEAIQRLIERIEIEGSALGQPS